LATCLAGSAWLFASGCATANKQAPDGSARAANAPTPQKLLGIEVLAIRLSAGGTMLDFRYRVVDPEKALSIMNRSIKPYLIDEATGARFAIPSSPKIGPMRQTTPRPEAGRVYWLLFGNPARSIKPGSLVTVVVGDFRLEHLVVR
jgi:hypothetical protein